MITLVDGTLRDEAARFSLRFRCQDCAHFDPGARACSGGYPSAPHRDVALEADATLVFCKQFELT